MVKHDPLEWIIVGVGDGRMVRAMWYQKMGGLPKFEAYDMNDRANKRLYNKILREERITPKVDPPKKDPPKKDPPKKDPPKKDPPVKNPGPIVKTALSIAYAPAIDEEGWIAIIEKPSSMANAKVEFRYDRRDTGAAVTCFTNVKTDRVIEPLANNDAESQVVALVGGQRVGDSRIMRVDLDPGSWLLAGDASKGQLVKTKLGASVDYAFGPGIVKAGLAPRTPVGIPDGTKRFVIWIKPDGSNNNLFARFKDETGAEFKVFLGILSADADRNGWRAVVIPFANVPLEAGQAAPKGKLEWVNVLYIEAADKNQPKSGTIEFGPAAYEF